MMKPRAVNGLTAAVCLLLAAVMQAFAADVPPVKADAQKAGETAPASVQAAGQEDLSKKVGQVPQASLQSAFQILRSEYIRRGDLTFDELNRAALQGLLERLDLGAELVSRVEAERPPARKGLMAEKLTDDILYLRPLSYSGDVVAKMETALKKHSEARGPFLILDLRSVVPHGDFEVAAAMLELFVSQGELLFKLKHVGDSEARLFIASRPTAWQQSLVILVDQETCNLGETVAAVLQKRKAAVVVGSATRGATVKYDLVPLDAEWLLRFARAEMLLDGDVSLFEVGVKPDLVLDLPPAAKRQVYDAAESAKAGLFDHSVPRFNEAALLARKNPELDSYIRRSSGQTLEEDRPAVRDTVLQRAVDMLSMTTHLDGTRLKWPAAKKSVKPASSKPAPSATRP